MNPFLYCRSRYSGGPRSLLLLSRLLSRDYLVNVDIKSGILYDAPDLIFHIQWFSVNLWLTWVGSCHPIVIRTFYSNIFWYHKYLSLVLDYYTTDRSKYFWLIQCLVIFVMIVCSNSVSSCFKNSNLITIEKIINFCGSIFFSLVCNIALIVGYLT